MPMKLSEGAKPLELMRISGRIGIKPLLVGDYEITQAGTFEAYDGSYTDTSPDGGG
jgi:hypothetical protein